MPNQEGEEMTLTLLHAPWRPLNAVLSQRWGVWHHGQVDEFTNTRVTVHYNPGSLIWAHHHFYLGSPPAVLFLTPRSFGHTWQKTPHVQVGGLARRGRQAFSITVFYTELHFCCTGSHCTVLHCFVLIL